MIDVIDALLMSTERRTPSQAQAPCSCSSPPCCSTSTTSTTSASERPTAAIRCSLVPVALSSFTFHPTRFPMDAGLDRLQARPKQLPPVGVAKGNELPLPPPSPLSSTHRPSPPPKGMYDDEIGHPPTYSQRDERPLPSPQSDVLSPPFLASPPGSPASFPGSSTSHGSPSIPPTIGDGSRAKKVNPFVDLMETEKTYVETLSGIIRVCFSSALPSFLI